MSNENINNHLDLLGKRARDKVTGLEGVISTVSFDLYGCIQAIISPPADGSKLLDGCWFDVKRLDILDYDTVMVRPNFDQGYVAEGNKGAAEKPLP